MAERITRAGKDAHGICIPSHSKSFSQFHEAKYPCLLKTIFLGPPSPILDLAAVNHPNDLGMNFSIGGDYPHNLPGIGGGETPGTKNIRNKDGRRNHFGAKSSTDMTNYISIYLFLSDAIICNPFPHGVTTTIVVKGVKTPTARPLGVSDHQRGVLAEFQSRRLKHSVRVVSAIAADRAPPARALRLAKSPTVPRGCR